MENNRDKKQWIDETMNSLSGLQRIDGSSDMYEQVMKKIRTGKPNAYRFPVARVAVAALFLLIVNIASVLHFSKQKNASEPQSVSQVINEDISSLSEGSF